jgi:hypothetical protein
MKAFYPYGQEGGSAPPASPRLPLGAAEIAAGDGRQGIEVYALERAAEDWLLHAQAFDEPWRLLGRVHHSRLPADAAEVATELLSDLWTLRHAGRLRFVRGLEFGALGAPRWQRIEARIPQPAPLEQALRAEGHDVHEIRGPVGTVEHVLRFKRS